MPEAKKGTWLHTKDGDLDPTWMFVGVLLFTGVFGFLVEVIRQGQASGPAWAWLGGFAALALLAAVPIARAKILKDATIVGGVSNAIGSVASTVTETLTKKTEVSTDTKQPPEHFEGQ